MRNAYGARLDEVVRKGLSELGKSGGEKKKMDKEKEPGEFPGGPVIRTP